MNDDIDTNDDALAGIDLDAWRVPPPRAADRPAILVRALAPAAAPSRRRRAWLVAGLLVLNAAIAAVIAILISRPASRPAPVVVAPAGPADTSNDPTVRELVRRLDAERHELERRLAEIDELRKLADELAAKLDALEKRDVHPVPPRKADRPPAPPTPPVTPATPLVTPPVPAVTPPVAQPDSTSCDEVSCVLTQPGDWRVDACCAKFINRTPPPKSPGLPDNLDRAAISNAMAGVRERVAACGKAASEKGIVKLHVRVGADGRVTNVVVTQTPAAKLGGCVAGAVVRASFPATKQGGSFSYPFVF